MRLLKIIFWGIAAGSVLAVLAAIPANAAAFCNPVSPTAPLTACVNQSCDTGLVADLHGLGVSTMDHDQQNIIFCLKNAAGALVWKSATQAPGFPANYPVTATPSISGFNCNYYTDSSANVYLRITGGMGGGWGVDTGWEKTANNQYVEAPNTEPGNLYIFSCIAEPTGIYFSFTSNTGFPQTYVQTIW